MVLRAVINVSEAVTASTLTARWCHETFFPCSSMSSLRIKRLGNRGLIPGRDFLTQSKFHPPFKLHMQ